MRSFISLNISKSKQEELFKVQEETKLKVSQLNDKFLESIKWEVMNKFHITLLFLGDVNETSFRLIDSNLCSLQSESTGSINFVSSVVKAFPNLKFPRVLIIDLINEDGRVFKLSEKLNLLMKGIGYKIDKPFHPHVTIGRVKRGNKINLRKLENEININISFSIKNFYLMKSELKPSGSEYAVVKEYKL